MTERFLCVHAHFYQPPRENPWLEAIEVQDSAYPHHDWNERVTAECYAPNAECRILDGEGRITDIVDNYSKISFNFGPTLLAWMEQKAPEVYAAIQAADRESKAHYAGHGSALAQAYNHMIMPLANSRDKLTQVIWGIRDFEHRFGRSPEGMWLPEAAVDLETLDALATHGILFTILSPHSARQMRRIGDGNWQDVSQGRIDPSRPYQIRLPSGRTLVLFFYDGPISRAVAFENLLAKGEDFANRLLGAFADGRNWTQLGHIATDGETYGHHRPHGDMALAYALHYIATQSPVRLTNYGEFLERNPPAQDVEIFESSSWSCAHGVERWRSNCGCNSGMHPGWNQNWRKPLREAMDWLRDTLLPMYEEEGRRLFGDPWQARDDYVRVILDRSEDTLRDFFVRNTGRELAGEERIRALKLLELQRHAMLMYTSCGWFFDELSGIETVQAIQYAARCIQLAGSFVGDINLEREFLRRLSRAKSNLPEHKDGRRVYERLIKPSMLDLTRVGAHYAISSLFEDFGPQTRVYCYDVAKEDLRTLSSGRTRLVMGRAKITSKITAESSIVSFGVVHLGDHNITGGVREFADTDSYDATLNEITNGFNQGDFTELIRVVDRQYGTASYTLKLLFKDEQRKIVRQILGPVLAEAESAYRQLYENRAPLLRFLAALGMPPIRRLQAAAEFTLNAELREAIEADPLNLKKIHELLEEVRRIGVPLDRTTLEFALAKKLEAFADQLRSQPFDLSLLRSLDAAVDLARAGPLAVQLWKVQNVYFRIMKAFYPQIRDKSAAVDVDPEQWLQAFRSLGAKLCFRVE